MAPILVRCIFHTIKKSTEDAQLFVVLDFTTWNQIHEHNHSKWAREAREATMTNHEREVWVQHRRIRRREGEETLEVSNTNVEQALNFLHYLELWNPFEKGSSPKAIDPLNPKI